MPRPTSADPKTDFAFKRIFGSEEHKDVLVAFLNDILARKTGYLERRLNLSTSEVLQRAIDRYYDEIRQEAGLAEEILTSTGFVGCGEAAPELSESYKAELTR